MKHLLHLFATILLFISCEDSTKNNLKADFSYTLASGYIVTFTNLSENSSRYKWDFGDGTFSVIKEPVHSYNSSGKYTVKLISSYGLLSDSVVKTITIENIPIEKKDPVAGFDFLINPLLRTVRFINRSINSNNYLWDFGDGTSSILAEPSHSYSDYGIYKVKLIASNGIKNDSSTNTFNLVDTVSLNNQKLIKYFTNINIDVESDGVNDLVLYTNSNGGITLYEYGINVKSLNNCQISFLNAKAYRYVFNDRIVNTSNFSSESKYITYDVYKQYGGSFIDSTWIKNDFGYIGFRKIINNKSRIGWIKLKVAGTMDVTLISFKIPSETESLLIDK